MRLVALTAGAAVALLAAYLLWPSGKPAPAAPPAVAAAPSPPPPPAAPPSRRPVKPPGPDDPHPPPPPGPITPTPSAEWRAAVAERVRGTPNPGETAFRALSDLYVDENLAMAEEQAKLEGITVGEVRELTHFGLLVLATQRVADVEELLGHGLTDEQREELAALMQSANHGFKAEMRALVARGASPAERGELIRRTRERYLADFYVTTGMNAALLDDLLAGNVALPPAPPPEAAVSEPGPKDTVVSPPRPAAANQ